MLRHKAECKALLEQWCLCRPLALSQLAIGISAGLLIVTSRADTVLLFAGRACSMGSFAILYVYTPEVGLDILREHPLMQQCYLQYCNMAPSHPANLHT